MSQSLIKVFEYSIIPSISLILGKIFGIYLVILVEDLPWTFQEYSENIFSSGPSFRPEDIEIVTSYSDLFMYLAIATYFSFHLVRLTFFSEHTVKPTLMAKLANKNLLKLVQSSYEVYHAGATNTVFLWIATAFVLVNTLLGNTYVFIGILAFITSVILTALLLQDVYKEIENIKRKPGSYNWV